MKQSVIVLAGTRSAASRDIPLHKSLSWGNTGFTNERISMGLITS
jgi:hypothetical protein